MNNQKEGISFECPCCRSLDCRSIGKIAVFLEDVFFSGSAKADPGKLYECRQCHLFFRWPVLSQERYTELYKKLATDRWPEEGTRPDWDTLLEIIKKYASGKKILDIGAFTGGFLNRLGPEWSKSVIEPNPLAQRKCEEKGLKMLGSVIEDVKTSEAFDVLCLLDLLEHMVQPYDFLEKLKKWTAPKGITVIYTGTTDALSWRIQQADIWYIRYPEHNSFMSKKWFQWAADKLGMDILHYETLSHFDFSGKQKIRQALAAMFYALNKSMPEKVFIKNVYPFNQISRWQGPPVWNSLKDHCAVVLRRRN